LRFAIPLHKYSKVVEDPYLARAECVKFLQHLQRLLSLPEFLQRHRVISHSLHVVR
jgi:hypothetical protein